MVDLSFAKVRRLKNRLLAGRSVDMNELAVSRHVLAPSEVETVRPALCQDGDLDRVISLAPTRAWEAEERLIRGGEVEHAATIAYTVEDAFLDNAHVYCGAAKMLAGWERNQPAAEARYCRLDTAHLVSSWPASHYFGHFVWDTLPLELLPPADEASVALGMMSYAHAEAYRALLQQPAPQVIWRGHVRRLTFYSDFGQNSFRAMRYRTLRDRLREMLPLPPAPAPGVFIRRGTTGETRSLVNEGAVEQALRRLGFDVVDPDRDDAEEILRRINGARIIVSVEGSQISHALYTVADDGAFIVLQPPDRFSMSYKEFTDCLGIRFAFLVGHPVDGGFMVHPEEIEQMLRWVA